MSLRTFTARLVKSRLGTSRKDFSDAEAEQQARSTVATIREMTEAQRKRYFRTLDPAEKKELNDLIWAVAWVECRDNIETFANYVKTKDEHATGDFSVRPFPLREEKPYIWEIIDTILAEPVLAVEKSRQLLVTWIACMYSLWTAKFHKNRLVFLQSKKEEDAANLVFNTEWQNARISFIESNLPTQLRSDVSSSYAKLSFKKEGSLIWGIPEGGDQIRSYTPSLVVSDEAAFQPEFQEAWKALIPAIKGGGRVLIISSARNGAYMKQLISRV